MGLLAHGVIKSILRSSFSRLDRKRRWYHSRRPGDDLRRAELDLPGQSQRNATWKGWEEPHSELDLLAAQLGKVEEEIGQVTAGTEADTGSPPVCCRIFPGSIATSGMVLVALVGTWIAWSAADEIAVEPPTRWRD